MRCLILPRLVAVLGLSATTAMAYGPQGHHTVGAIADRLIAGTPAAAQVAALLGGLSLENAAVWADCAKGVDERTHKYVRNTARYPECAVFETPEGIAAMEDFFNRNDQQCQPAAGEEVCDKGYHYTDIAIQHTRYNATLKGARPTDIVAAVRAALIVLQGGPSRPPFGFKDKREALLVLSHYVGDLHQPLHVGAIYLGASGKRVNPDVGTYDPATSTRGGNQILIGGNAAARLHAAWDGVPASLQASKADALAAVAKTVPVTRGTLPDWPQAWADETLMAARKVYVGMKFSAKSGATWNTSLPPDYTMRMTAIKTERIEKAGARLAQILKTIWP